jgi:acylphosphatase
MGCFQFHVRGRVQGVGFRYFARQEAEALGLAGFARNLPDGSVEVVAEGPDQALQAYEARLREGPGFARVDSVDRVSLAPRGDQGFHIR